MIFGPLIYLTLQPYKPTLISFYHLLVKQKYIFLSNNISLFLWIKVSIWKKPATGHQKLNFKSLNCSPKALGQLTEEFWLFMSLFSLFSTFPLFMAQSIEVLYHQLHKLIIYLCFRYFSYVHSLTITKKPPHYHF